MIADDAAIDQARLGLDSDNVPKLTGTCPMDDEQSQICNTNAKSFHQVFLSALARGHVFH
jgi:hypothetical protein